MRTRRHRVGSTATPPCRFANLYPGGWVYQSHAQATGRTIGTVGLRQSGAWRGLRRGTVLAQVRCLTRMRLDKAANWRVQEIFEIYTNLRYNAAIVVWGMGGGTPFVAVKTLFIQILWYGSVVTVVQVEPGPTPPLFLPFFLSRFFSLRAQLEVGSMGQTLASRYHQSRYQGTEYHRQITHCSATCCFTTVDEPHNTPPLCSPPFDCSAPDFSHWSAAVRCTHRPRYE